ncbi:MAG: hypothetical protein FWD23_01490 [Oscillospiraceae bacterium]|nr:hypothetical protein [Oscillospiraceae bacterium]
MNGEKEKEASDFGVNRIEIEPRWLLCMNCLRGGGKAECMAKDHIPELWRKIDETPEAHLTLVGAFDEMGARTKRFDTQTPAERRKDLDVLQRLGLCFTDTRSARDLFNRIAQKITSLDNICRYPDNPYGKWAECELADGEYYAKGSKPLRCAQNPEEMASGKILSCRAIAKAGRIVIRIHHLLCIVCFAGGGGNGPLPMDNLYEAWVKFRENPDILVTLAEGPGECCICPPCDNYMPQRGLCVSGCHLRDRKKDLDTFVALGLSPGDTLTARELYKRIYERIPHVTAICSYETNTGCEWNGACGTISAEAYEKGLADGILP